MEVRDEARSSIVDDASLNASVNGVGGGEVEGRGRRVEEESMRGGRGAEPGKEVRSREERLLEVWKLGVCVCVSRLLAGERLEELAQGGRWRRGPGVSLPAFPFRV